MNDRCNNPACPCCLPKATDKHLMGLFVKLTRSCGACGKADEFHVDYRFLISQPAKEWVVYEMIDDGPKESGRLKEFGALEYCDKCRPEKYPLPKPA